MGQRGKHVAGCLIILSCRRVESSRAEMDDSSRIEANQTRAEKLLRHESSRSSDAREAS